VNGAARPWVKICGVTRATDAECAARLGADFLGLNFWSGSPRHVELAAARELAAAARAARRSIRLVGLFVNERPERVEEIVETLGLDLVQLHGDESEAELSRWGDRLVRVVRGDLLPSNPDAGGDGGPTGTAGDADAFERRSLKGELERGGVARGDRPWLGAGRQAGERASESPPLALVDTTLGPQSRSLQQNVSASVSTGLRGPSPFAYLLDAPRAPRRGGAEYGGGGLAWAWGAAQPWVEACVRPVLVAGGVRPGNAAAALAASGAAGVDVASGVESAPGVKDEELMRRLIEEVRGEDR
jgi:phosphoribosylanthranilate isomerase